MPNKSFLSYLAGKAASTAGVSMVPGLNPAGDAVVALEEEYFKINRTTEGNFWTVASVEPFIHRMRDRAFIGNAIGMGPTRSNTNTTWVPDAATGANWIPRDSQFISMSDNGTIAIAGGSRVSDHAGIAGGAAAIGVAGFNINDSATFDSAWALYGDVQHEPGAGGGNSYGLELAVKNKATNLTANPYDRTSGAYGLWLQGAGDPSYGGVGTNPANAGIMFVKNQMSALTSGWNVGIVFDDDSLTFDGSSRAPAIRMAKGHCIEWWTPETGGTLGAFITSAVDDDANQVQQLFNDNSVAFLGANGKNMAQFTHVASGVNYLAFVNAATGNLPSISAAGDDAAVGLVIIPKSTSSGFLNSGDGTTKLRWNNTGLGFFTTSAVARKTGWGTATGTATRTTFATGSVTLSELAERVKALIDDLHSTVGYGLITT